MIGKEKTCTRCHYTFHKDLLIIKGPKERLCPNCAKRKTVVHEAPENWKSDLSKFNRESIFYNVPTYIFKIEENERSEILSRQPIRCPAKNCDLSLSAQTIGSHFELDHLEIPIIVTPIDVTIPFKFITKEVAYNIPQCFLAFKIKAKDLRKIFPKMFKNELPIDIIPTLMFFSTRIPAVPQLQLDAGDAVTKKPEKNNTPLEMCDTFLFWISSNVRVNLSYTMAVTSPNQFIRQRFHGPVLMYDEIKSANYAKYGHGMALMDSHLKKYNGNGKGPLNFDVVIHNAHFN